MTKDILKQISESRLKNKGLNLTKNNLYWFNAICREIETEFNIVLSDAEKGFLLMDAKKENKTMKFTYKNTYHNTEINTKYSPEDLENMVYQAYMYNDNHAKSTLARLRNKLCGINGCTCSNDWGERN